MQDVSIEPDGDDARHWMEAKDIMPCTRSRTRVAENRGHIKQIRIRVRLNRKSVTPSQIHECDDNGDGFQCLDPASVGVRYDDVQHARSPLREDRSDILRDIRHHFTPPVDSIDPLSFTQDPSNIQQDRGHHFTPPMDPIDPLSFTQDRSYIQGDIRHHFTPLVDSIDPSSLS
ncbi:hypothetical protein QYF36_023892 [Acer negundo]|nr:hypothetical protein QYF36_023892 [Acer negundo]